MGYNSTLLILNDALGYIETDTDFGSKVTKAISHLQIDPSSKDISSFGFVNAATVVMSHHADDFQGLVVGSNTTWRMGSAGHWSPDFRDKMSEDERKLYFLKSMASSMGYRLVKK